MVQCVVFQGEERREMKSICLGYIGEWYKNRIIVIKRSVSKHRLWLICQQLVSAKGLDELTSVNARR